MNSDFRIQIGYLRHPKIKKLKRRMGGDAVFAHIQLLEFAALHRHDGRLTGMDAEDIAVAADWEGDPQEFIDALLSLPLLDKDEDGTLMLHDWLEHNPWAAGAGARSEIARNAAFVRWHGSPNTQESSNLQESSNTPQYATAHAQPNTPHAVSNAPSINEHCPEQVQAMPLSSPILSSPKEGEYMPKPPLAVVGANMSGEVTHEQPKKEEYPVKPEAQDIEKPVRARPQPRHYDLKGFERFWAACPKKRDKDQALIEWDKLRPNEELQASILADIAAKIPTDDWQRDGGQFVPYPCRYLKHRRWEDEFLPVPAALIAEDLPSRPYTVETDPDFQRNYGTLTATPGGRQ